MVEIPLSKNMVKFSAVHRSRSFELFCQSWSWFTSGSTYLCCKLLSYFSEKALITLTLHFCETVFLSCRSNTINSASYERCMRKIPCDKDSVFTLKSSNLVKFQFSHVFTLKSSNLVKFQFSHVFCQSPSFFPPSRSFFCQSQR